MRPPTPPGGARIETPPSFAPLAVAALLALICLSMMVLALLNGHTRPALVLLALGVGFAAAAGILGRRAWKG